MRMGRKLDLLVVSLWRSRGYELDGVEIKVSGSDWKRELDDAAKADWWWRHVHRFWVAVPVALAPKVRPDLPTGWGLLACSAGTAPKRAQVVVKAEKHAPEPIAWPNAVGLIRAAADAGIGALQRAEERGRQRGYEQGKQEAARTAGEVTAQPELERLRAAIATFEEASGLRIVDTYRADLGRLGRIVAMVEKATVDPAWTAGTIRSHAQRLGRNAEELNALADALASDLQAMSTPRRSPVIVASIAARPDCSHAAEDPDAEDECWRLLNPGPTDPGGGTP